MDVLKCFHAGALRARRKEKSVVMLHFSIIPLFAARGDLSQKKTECHFVPQLAELSDRRRTLVEHGRAFEANFVRCIISAACDVR